MEQKNDFYAPGLMDLSNYRLNEIDDKECWDDFVNNSEQGTLFNQAIFLEALDDKAKLLGCYKGSELKGAICVFEKNERHAIRPAMVIYNSFMLQKPDLQQAKANQFAEQFRTISAMTKELTERYDSIAFQTHPSFIDIRPLLWHNYGTDLQKFNCEPRYTSIISLKDSIDFIEDFQNGPLYKQCAKSRRQEIRYAISKNVKFEVKFDLELFASLYRDTFERQGLKADEYELKQMIQISNALYQAGQLKMYVVSDHDGKVGSIAIFGHDKKRAYYLYGANSPVARESHTGSFVIYEACRDLLQQGLYEVDLEGVNSPARGHFKMSFGGELETYYSVQL